LPPTHHQIFLTPPVTLEWADDPHPAGFVLRKTKKIHHQTQNTPTCAT